jgi:hypothetical protein
VSTQAERVGRLAVRLLDGEAARRQAVRDGHSRLASDIANINRELIGEALAPDLRSLVTAWMLRLGEIADQEVNR